MNKLSDDVTRDLPEGTVTFLFTDIEGSTKLLRQLGDDYAKVLAVQRRVLRANFGKWHGSEVDTQGDSFFVSFPRATEAAAAAVEIQRSLAEHDWPQGGAVRVRMGLHTGEPWTAEEGYVGMAVHRAARIASVGYGCQVLLSETTAALVRDDLPEGTSLLDLGRHRLKDMAHPEHIRQLVIRGLPSEFPPLKSVEALGLEISAEEPVRLPAFLEEDMVEEPEPVFVGRERELELLFNQLDRAIEGQGGVFFIAGDAGSGKTALMENFSLLAQERVPDLLVAGGGCSAFTGSGDPYSPFRSLLRELTGDVETAWKAGAVSRERARRLWSALPSTARALVKYGPDLVDTFITGPGLLDRVTTAVPAEGGLLKQMKDLVEKDKHFPRASEQRRLFEEVQDMLVELSSEWPLLLLLDDMQWGDSGSINLLFHLGRELAGSRVLVLCAYRPEETALGRDGSLHPLEPVLNELKRSFGQIMIDLIQVHGERFIDQFIDSEPNHLKAEFRRRMFRHTAGHALFTVELLRNLQERGDLVKDIDGYWAEGPHLDWSTLPVRVEGVIRARIGRLEEELRELLSVAAVEGADFTAQVVAQVQRIQERKLLRTLSRELEKHHQLVTEGEEVRVGSRLLSRYSFAHTLFQRYLYNDLSAGERRVLHGEIGTILEELYADRLAEITVQLGKHFTAAGDSAKAIPYLIKAGDTARLSFAFKEAVAFYEQAVILLRESDNQELLGRVLMRQGLVYHNDYQFDRSRKAFEEAFAIQSIPQVKTSQQMDSLRTFRDPIDYDPPSNLDPTTATNAVENFYINQLFAGLVAVSIKGEIAPELAYRWDILDGGRRYVFYLRDDALWSDGHPVTANDFEYSWKRMLRPGSNVYPANRLYDVQGAEAYHQGLLYDAEEVGVRAIDEHTLAVDLEEPVGYFLQSLPDCMPIPQHLVKSDGDRWAVPTKLVGNGPYIIESWQPKKELTFVRNLLYRGQYSGNVQRIESKRMTPSETCLAYELDKLDIAWLSYMSRSERTRLLQKYPSELVTHPLLTTYFLELNLSRKPLDDFRVRRALALALDKRRLIRHAFRWSFPATGGCVPPGMPGHVDGIGVPFDLDQARMTMAEVGFPQGHGIPRLNLIAGKHWSWVVHEIANQWTDNLDLKLNVQLLPDAEFYNAIDNVEYDIAFSGWSADFPDPDCFLRVGLQQIVGWSDERYDELVNQARRIRDRSRRLELYRQAEMILADEQPLIPLIYFHIGIMLKPRVMSRHYGYRGWLWKDMVIE